MRFIRKNGHVIPIGDNSGARDVSGLGHREKQQLKKDMMDPKKKAQFIKNNGGTPLYTDASQRGKSTSLDRFKTGYGLGAFVGSIIGWTSGNPLKGAAIGGALGGTARAAFGPRNRKDNPTKGLEVPAALGIVGTGLLLNRATGGKATAVVNKLAKAGRATNPMKYMKYLKRTKVKGKDGNVIFGKFPKR